MMRFERWAGMGVALLGAALLAHAGTDYPIPAAVQNENRGKVEACRAGAYWSKAPFACCAVTPLAGVRRTPDRFPHDGKFTAPVRIVAAQGEYEPGSFQLFAFEDLPSVELKAGDLAGEGRARLPASAIDLKVVKIWYQMGTAWNGFHADHLRRLPTPELLLRNEKLIRVDHEKQENYLLCDYGGGVSRYRWISFTGAAVDHTYDGWIRNEWIHDADVLQPVALQKNAFKQFMVTVHVPETASPGVYRGEISASVGGSRVLGIPLEVRVLPFRLPRPATFRDLNREFYGSAFIGGLNISRAHKLARNLVAHNVLNPLLPQIPTDLAAREFFEMAQATGISTNPLLAILPGARLTTSFPLKETDRNYDKYLELQLRVSNTLSRIRTFAGDVQAYGYGIDEAGPDTVRAERATWQMFQQLGGKVMTTTRMHPYQLFNLDFALLPVQPSAGRKLQVDALHDANPDILVGWYADPHSGPENPAYARRIYGWNTWRNNYDLFCQYILFRDDWTEFWIAKESNLRGLMLCYPQDDDVIDTLAWEGVREALDDIRYATLLRQLSAKAMASESMDTVYLGRAATTWLAQVDYMRSDMDTLRYEMIRRCLDIQTRLAQEEK